MPKTGPGKSHRQSIDVFELFAMFPDDRKAEEWFVKARWPDGVHCPDCGSFNVRERPSRKPQPYRCQSCRMDFSVKTGTVMHGSKLGLQKWAVAIYYMNTELKGESSMRLHRLLGVTQRTAWYLAHRIREAFESPDGIFSGPVEVDEVFIGGKKKGNRRPGIKTPVVGVKDRATKQVRARVTVMDKRTLIRFVEEHIEEGAKVYSDGYEAYRELPNQEWVNHSAGEYVRGDVHTNSIESFWSMFKRGFHGTYHHMGRQHLHRYVQEFEGRQNVREMDTIDQMETMVRRMERKRLKYSVLTGRETE